MVYAIAEQKLREALERETVPDQKNHPEETDNQTCLSGVRGYYSTLQRFRDGEGHELATDSSNGPFIAWSCVCVDVLHRSGLWLLLRYAAMQRGGERGR